MTIQQKNEQAASGSDFLTSQEQAICKQIATGEAPHSQRASALLSLNEGSIQAQVAEQTGLSGGQVKYWLAKFRKQRLGIFPDTLLDELGAKAEPKLVAEIEEGTESVTEKKDSTEKTKDKKAKKEKKAKKKTKKKEKKTKKTKKSKKEKKTKKKGKKAKKS